MNHRDYKQFAVGAWYHVYNRGNAQANVFLDNQDFSFFLYRLKENMLGKILQVAGPGRSQRQVLPPNSFSIAAYCLMPNHYHFLIQQIGDIPVAKLIQKICTSYSKYFNAKYSRVGHVFQDKFKAIQVDTNSQLIWLSAYIHTNPVIANIVTEPEKYPWSSYPDYLGLRNGTLCHTKTVLGQFSSISEYKDFVHSSLELTKVRKEIEHLLLD